MHWNTTKLITILTSKWYILFQILSKIRIAHFLTVVETLPPPDINWLVSLFMINVLFVTLFIKYNTHTITHLDWTYKNTNLVDLECALLNRSNYFKQTILEPTYFGNYFALIIIIVINYIRYVICQSYGIMIKLTTLI